jgi:hypothetical protein
VASLSGFSALPEGLRLDSAQGPSLETLQPPDESPFTDDDREVIDVCVREHAHDSLEVRVWKGKRRRVRLDEFYFTPMTIESGPIRCSARVLLNPASVIQPLQSAAV